MKLSAVSGARAFTFAGDFDYVREAGTEGERAAAEHIFAQLEGLGLRPQIEEFPIRRHWAGRAVFRVTKPYQKAYPVAGLRGSCPTGPEGIRAEFLFAEEGDDITLSRAAGKILLLSHRPSAGEYRKLTLCGAVGLLCVCGSPLDQGENRLPQTGKLPRTEFPALPAVLLHDLDAREIIDRGAAEAELFLELGEEDATSRNVTVRIPGTEYPDRIIALTAHYDSVPEGPGAYDNLAGAAIIFEVCRGYAAHPPRHTMEFTFFGAEEIGCKGSIEFLRQRKTDWQNYLVNLNVDLAGQALGGTVLGVTAGGSLAQALDSCLWRSGIGARIRQDVWSGDANVFAHCGIPAVTLDRDGYGMHTRNDTLALLSPWALERDARLIAFLANDFDGCDTPPFDRDIPDAFRVQLNRQYGAFLETQ